MKNLTPELKAYYMADFVENVLPCKDEFWKLDDGLADLLTRINKSNNIQTLYSRRRTYANDKNNVSSLWILVSENVKNSKIRIFVDECNKKLADFQCVPVEDIVQNLKPEIPMNCMTDSNYFNNGAVMISVKSPVQHNHEVFWKLLEKHLTKF